MEEASDVLIVLTRLEAKVDAHMAHSTRTIDDHEARLRAMENKVMSAKSSIVPVGGGLAGVSGLIAAVWQAIGK